jgi:hypothetical protein
MDGVAKRTKMKYNCTRKQYISIATGMDIVLLVAGIDDAGLHHQKQITEAEIRPFK